MSKIILHRLRYSLRFVFLFIGSIFVATLFQLLLWGTLVHGVIYYQAPFFYPGGCDFFMRVGQWIDQGATVVKSIDTSWSFKEPQQVIHGWNNGDLMIIWWLMVTSSLVFSVVLTWWLGRDRTTVK